MISLNKAFKDVYGERLRDRGYKKTKSKYPYLVRRVGDEIFYTITVVPTFSTKIGYRAFDIIGGVGTVYRGELPFERNPKYYTSWLAANRFAYGRMLNTSDSEVAAWNSELQESFNQNIWYFYEKMSDVSLLQSMRKSLDESERVLLKTMETVDTLEKCVEWYRKFAGGQLLIGSPEQYRAGLEKKDDSLLNFKLYSLEEYAAIQQNIFRKFCRKEKKAEEYEEMREEIACFSQMVSNPENMAWLEQELAARKKRNTELLESIMN